MKKVTLKEMLEELTECILENKKQPNYFWRTEYIEGSAMYLPIVQVDLMRGRFITINDDFSEYEWELKDSRIYKATTEKEGVKDER